MREMMLGIEGLALLRTAIDGDEDFVQARVAELRRIVDPASAEVPADAELSELDVADGYAAWAEKYDSLPNFILAVEQPAVDRLLADLPPGSAVDAACGTGRHSANLVRHGHDVIGVDQSPLMLEHAAAKVPAAQFRAGDLEELPLPDGAADLVLCGLALTHLPEIGRAIGELRRIVRPGGRLIVTDVHPMMVLLHGQVMFVHWGDGLAFVRNHVHLASDYLSAFAAHDLIVRSCQEPLFAGPLPPGGHEERISEAANAAWADVPSAIVWEVQAPE